MEDLEKLVRRIVREEIARALSAAEQVANNAMQGIGGRKDVARGVLANVMERVARDVLTNAHPALEPEHTASTEPVHTITSVPERPKATCTCHRHTHVMGHEDGCGSPFCYCLTPVRARPEHTSTENSGECTTCGHRPHAAGECEWWGENPCLCTKHTSKHNPGCGHTVCDGWSDCRSWTGVEPEHTSTEAPRTCTACEHGEHDQGKCTMHVYLRGVASPCPCLASRTLGAQS